MAAEWALDRRPPSIDVLADRQSRIIDDIQRLDKEKADRDAVTAIAEDVSSLRKLLIGFFVSVALASTGFGFTILELVITNHK